MRCLAALCPVLTIRYFPAVGSPAPDLRAIAIRLNSSLPGKFGDRFRFFDMAVLSQVSECDVTCENRWLLDTFHWEYRQYLSSDAGYGFIHKTVAFLR